MCEVHLQRIGFVPKRRDSVRHVIHAIRSDRRSLISNRDSRQSRSSGRLRTCRDKRSVLQREDRTVPTEILVDKRDPRRRVIHHAIDIGVSSPANHRTVTSHEEILRRCPVDSVQIRHLDRRLLHHRPAGSVIRPKNTVRWPVQATPRTRDEDVVRIRGPHTIGRIAGVSRLHRAGQDLGNPVCARLHPNLTAVVLVSTDHVNMRCIEPAHINQPVRLWSIRIPGPDALRVSVEQVFLRNEPNIIRARAPDSVGQRAHVRHRLKMKRAAVPMCDGGLTERRDGDVEIVAACAPDATDQLDIGSVNLESVEQRITHTAVPTERVQRLLDALATLAERVHAADRTAGSAVTRIRVGRRLTPVGRVVVAVAEAGNARPDDAVLERVARRGGVSESRTGRAHEVRTAVGRIVPLDADIVARLLVDRADEACVMAARTRAPRAAGAGRSGGCATSSARPRGRGRVATRARVTAGASASAATRARGRGRCTTASARAADVRRTGASAGPRRDVPAESACAARRGCARVTAGARTADRSRRSALTARAADVRRAGVAAITRAVERSALRRVRIPDLVLETDTLTAADRHDQRGEEDEQRSLHGIAPRRLPEALLVHRRLLCRLTSCRSA